MSVSEAVATRDERVALEAMADSLAASMDVAEPSVMAQVAARLQAVLARLADLGPAEKQVSALDDLASRRAGRQSKAKVG
jgi:hypothetical protein